MPFEFCKQQWINGNNTQSIKHLTSFFVHMWHGYNITFWAITSSVGTRSLMYNKSDIGFHVVMDLTTFSNFTYSRGLANDNDSLHKGLTANSQIPACLDLQYTHHIRVYQIRYTHIPDQGECPMTDSCHRRHSWCTNSHRHQIQHTDPHTWVSHITLVRSLECLYKFSFWGKKAGVSITIQTIGKSTMNFPSSCWKRRGQEYTDIQDAAHHASFSFIFCHACQHWPHVTGAHYYHLIQAGEWNTKD